ncbi:single stranded DNA-binding protein [Synechococcus phage S-B68]|nr:single stranded DNA-binding protein [Synechococcus phage S-B68]
MSFSDLRSNKKNVFAKLQKQLENSTKVGTVDERFWKLSTDKAGNGYAVIRFLPAGDGEDMPFVKLYSHAFQGPGGWYIENSLTTLGKNDPLGEYNRELWNSGDESLKEQVRKQKRKLSYYSNIYVVKDPANPDNEGKVFLFRYGKKIHDKIMEAVNGDELEGRAGINPFDFWEGADFKLRSKKVAGYPNYDSSEFLPQGTLEDLDDAQLESIWKREHSLQSIVGPDQFKSYEQLQERLNRVLGRKGAAALGGEQTAAAAPAKRVEDVVSAKPSFAKKEEPVVEAKQEVVEEDDDVMDYFKRLAED